MAILLNLIPISRHRLYASAQRLGGLHMKTCNFAKPVAGQPIVAYMGDDARNEYIYKFVSTALWNPAEADTADKLAIGDKYMDKGTLFVAKFNADGSGEWLELSIKNPTIANLCWL